ncbi:type IV secretion system protein [Caulobacter henricii]|uniref:Type VI secretion protein n=1 Tax=Caulobacter henricii TaxID=69395 RepID=A0A0P0NYP9_9CAUL|nr:type IV secretion system protein [Caulobacter henricii]ALL12868.1 hypothetical protein AQ619_05580 [Caulobacter henricii]
MKACPALDMDAGAIRGVLETVDCHARFYAQSGYEALGSPGSPYQAWLTAFLVIYVAVLGYRLLLGSGARMSDLPLTALKIGAVLALATNWTLFQTLVFDLVYRTPIEVARLLTGPAAQSSAFAGDPVGALQVAYDQLSLSAEAFGKAAGPGASAFSNGNAAAAEALWQAARALFFTTAGVFSVAMVGAAVLTALGPIFVALLLFPATRGVFEGWVRALLATLMAAMLGWISTALMLTILESGLLTLAQERVALELNVDTALSVSGVVMIFALVQVGLVLAGALMACGFRLKARTRHGAMEGAPQTPSRVEPPAGEVGVLSRAERLAASLSQTSTYAPRYSGPPVAATRSAAAVPSGAPLGTAGATYRRPSVRGRDDFGGGAA